MGSASPLAHLYQDAVTPLDIDGHATPWEFAPLEEEYAALRQRVALFDLSHIGRIRVTGGEALGFLQRLVAKDIAYLFPERSLTTLVLDDDGTPVDVIVVYKIQGGYVVETSPARGELVLAHLQHHAPPGLQLEDLSTTEAVVAIEGPYAWDVLGKVVDPQLTGIPYHGVATTSWEGDDVVVSRSGFTGEYGYKLIAPIEVATRLWHALSDHGVAPVGYRTLEVAMTEIRQPILHRELDGDGTVIRCGLNWLVDIQKDEFLGRDAVLAAREAGADLLTVGFLADRNVDVPPGASVVAGNELEIGRVLHGVLSPTLDKQLFLARTQAEWTAASVDLEVRDAADEMQPVRTVSSPYVIPTSWTVPIL